MYVKLKTIKQFKFTGIIYYKWIIISHSITKISSDSCTEVTECGNGPVWRRLGCGEGYYSHEGSINGVNMPSIKRSKLLMSHDTISFQGLPCCCFFMYYNRGTTHEKKIGASLGTDLTIYYFNQLLEDKYPICANRTNYKWDCKALLKYFSVIPSNITYFDWDSLKLQ